MRGQGQIQVNCLQVCPQSPAELLQRGSLESLSWPALHAARGSEQEPRGPLLLPDPSALSSLDTQMAWLPFLLDQSLLKDRGHGSTVRSLDCWDE